MQDGRSVNVRVDRMQLEMLVKSDPKTFESIWNGQMLGVDLERVKPAVLHSLIEEAWRLRAPTKLLK